MNRDTTDFRRIRRLIVVVAAATLVLTACGKATEVATERALEAQTGGNVDVSGDGSEDSAGSAEVSAGTEDVVASASNDAPETTVAAAADDSDSIRDIDLGPRLGGLEVALKGTAELIDENTVQMTFDDGSIDGTGAFRACITAKSILDEGMVLILVYPDGEKTCE